jgi:predicted MFS family arabinose efflux permease
VSSQTEPIDQPVETASSIFRPGGWDTRLASILLMLILAGELAQLTYTYPANAIPQIALHFHTQNVAWVATVSSIAGGITAAMIGKLADRFGKKHVLLGVMTLTLIGLAISASASSFGMLLFGRALQGPSLAIIFLIPSLIRDIYPTRTIPLAVSVGTSGAGGFSIIAALLVGDVISTWGFRGAFWVPAAVGVIATLAVLTVVPGSDAARRNASLDVLGALLLGAGAAAILMATSLGGTWGWSSVRILVLLIGGIALIAVWVLRSLRVTEPLIDLRILSSRPIVATLVLSAIGIGVAVWYYTVMAFVVTGKGDHWGLGLPESKVSTYLTIFTAATFVTSFAAGAALRRFRLPTVAVYAMLAVIVGYGALALGLENKVVFALGSVVLGTVGGSVYAATYNLVVLVVAAEHQATAASVVSLCANFGSAIVSVLVFAVMNGQTQKVPGLYPHSAMLLATLIPAALGVIGLAVSVALHRMPGLRAGIHS